MSRFHHVYPRLYRPGERGLRHSACSVRAGRRSFLPPARDPTHSLAAGVAQACDTAVLADHRCEVARRIRGSGRGRASADVNGVRDLRAILFAARGTGRLGEHDRRTVEVFTLAEYSNGRRGPGADGVDRPGKRRFGSRRRVGARAISSDEIGVLRRCSRSAFAIAGLESLLPLLGIVWLAGVVVWLIWALLHVGRFQLLLRHARYAGTDIQAQANQLAHQMGLRHGPEVWLLPGPLPPLVWAAIGRVRIFFPAKLLQRLDETERASLLAHELAHVRRRDHWVRWLELVASALYWWYPLVLARARRMHIHEEECCDAWVVGEVPARTYAAAILNTLDFLAEDQLPLPVMASGLAGVEMLKRRLKLIMGGGTPKRLSSPMRCVVVLVGLLAMSLRPNLAQSEKKVEPAAELPTSKVEITTAAAIEEPTVFNAQPKSLLGGNNDVWSMAVSPDGKLLATGSGYWDRPGEVRVWNLATRKPLWTFAETLGVSSVAISPDGKRLASANWAREGRLRDLATG